MGWKETCPVKERARFCVEWDSGDETNFSRHCSQFGISRRIGYKWLECWRSDGPKGLADRSRRPVHSPTQIAAEIEEQLVGERVRRPHWGPKKLVAYLAKHQPDTVWPAPSTAGDILKRRGLVPDRKPHKRVHGQPGGLTVASSANHVWCVDFKGWWHTIDGSKVTPLTITDQSTRYVIRSNALRYITTAEVKAVFECAFKELGLPQYMRSDNGPPFAAAGLTGLTRLSVWWILLGILPERIAPGKPQQNGCHERMHGTMAREVEAKPAGSFREQQAQLAVWREEFNHVRPHEALGMATPASLYVPSDRSFPSRLPKAEYDEGVQVRQVDSSSKFRWKGQHLALGRALEGQRIGLIPEDNDRYTLIKFCSVPIARFDEKKQKLIPLKPTRGGGGVPPPPPRPS